MIKVYLFLILWVLISTGVPIYYHTEKWGFNWLQACMSFFLGLNFLICLWEVCLGYHITTIHKEYTSLSRKYKKNPFEAIMKLFMHDITINEICNGKFWSKIWSHYSLYDSSYSNRESFGFFIDVGNGWSMMIPTILMLYTMTYDINFSPIAVGVIGIISNYQMFYGTVIYFLSFFINNRHHNKSITEVALFVGLSNGIWFFFPLLGMYINYELIVSGSMHLLR